MTEAWTAPQVERTEPGLILGERPALEAWLDFHRDTLLLKCTGLTAGQLKERAVPLPAVPLGQVRHMTEVERWWFRIHAADTGRAFPCDPDQAGQDFEALYDADAAANIEAFKRETAHARAAAAGRRLDDVVPSHGHHPGRSHDIRRIYLHMIEEYAATTASPTSSGSESMATPETDTHVGISSAYSPFRRASAHRDRLTRPAACAGRIGPGQRQADGSVLCSIKRQIRAATRPSRIRRECVRSP
jgi:hypothetical protein